MSQLSNDLKLKKYAFAIEYLNSFMMEVPILFALRINELVSI